MNQPLPDLSGFMAGFARHQMAREAAASVSLSHPESCRCVACDASRGDEAAMARVLELLEDEASGV